MASEAGRLNRLSKEKSPYLLQHARNPVDWYPWGEEAFEKAKKENKPIFLSVGYSTCHWCHVMERESFESEEIGALLSRYFVSIKVDREERPDVDRVYMTFIQATEGSGGWPMSVFLTPELKPFLGGTYFPPQDSFMRPGFATVLRNVAKQWETNHAQLVQQGTRVMKILQEVMSTSGGPAQEVPRPECIEKACTALVSRFDKKYGGFGSAPKFPQPSILNLLLHCHAHNPSSAQAKEGLECALHTLRMMGRGGMHDHVGKGFHRYSTDARWHVPHFEKMLYDQGQLAATYSMAYQVTGEPVFKDTVEDILHYVARDLTDKDGGFYSAEDADSLPSEGDQHKKEGAFCVWAESDIRRLLTDKLPGQSEKTAADLFAHHYGVKRTGNVDPKQDPHNELKGQNVLIVEGSLEATAAAFSLSTAQAEQVLETSRGVLYRERQKRPKPHRDNKILTAWNGLMISGFACAARALDKEEYAKQALEAAAFVHSRLFNADKGTLLRSAYRDERGELSVGAVEGFADDYSFLIRGLLDLFDITQDAQWAEWANQLQGMQLELFWDEAGGGLFSNTGVDPSVLLRLKEDQDGAEPSPSSIAAFNLLRMGTLFDSQEFKEKAKRIFTSSKKMLDEHSVALCQMCVAYLDYLNPPTEIVICGSPMAEDARSMIKCVNRSNVLSRLLVVHDGSESTPVTKWLPPVRNMTQIGGKATAYVCKNFVCSQPVNEVDGLRKMLQQEEPAET